MNLLHDAEGSLGLDQALLEELLLAEHPLHGVLGLLSGESLGQLVAGLVALAEHLSQLRLEGSLHGIIVELAMDFLMNVKKA